MYLLRDRIEQISFWMRVNHFDGFYMPFIMVCHAAMLKQRRILNVYIYYNMLAQIESSKSKRVENRQGKVRLLGLLWDLVTIYQA